MNLKPIEIKDSKDDCLYRYEDDYEQIRLREFKIIKETNCGWWIKRWGWDNKDLKFVYKNGKNNFAKRTKEEALKNYYHRKRRHVVILNEKLTCARLLMGKARVFLEKQEIEYGEIND